MLNKEPVMKWIEALESGEYKQYKKAITNAPLTDYTKILSDATAFCCIGVGAKVLNSPPSSEGLGCHYRFIQSILGEDYYEIENTLVLMNDIQNKSFKEIAAYLRDQLILQETGETE